jgi:hypothetical protein
MMEQVYWRVQSVDHYHQKRPAPQTLTLFGGILTLLTPFCIAAYAGGLIAVFVTRPVVVTATSESTLFTAPAVNLTCTCSLPGTACVIGATFIAGNAVSDTCSNLTAAQHNVTFTGTRLVKNCYATRSSEGTTVFVPTGCQMSAGLESIANVPFDSNNVAGRKRSVTVVFPQDGTANATATSRWSFLRLREVHLEGSSPVNITVWWAVENQVALPNTACAGALGGDCFVFNMEAVFSVFVFQRLGDVLTLLAQIGGSFSLVMSGEFSPPLCRSQLTRSPQSPGSPPLSSSLSRDRM